MSFTIDECAMLGEAGYRAGWLNDAKVGDEVAMIPVVGYVRVPIEFFTITRLERKFLSDMMQVQFIAEHEGGVEQPLTYVTGWPCFIRSPKPVDEEPKMM